MVKLIDVSSAQNPKTIDWKRVKANGIEGVYIRCGDGIHSVDAAFNDHWTRANAEGLLTGAYYVLAPSTKDPIASAQHAMQCTGATTLPLCVDVERNTPLTAEEAPIWGAFLMDTLAHISGKTIVYTYASFKAALEKAGFIFTDMFIAAYPELHYETAKAEVLRRLILEDIRQYGIAVAKGDAKALTEAANKKFADGVALSKLGLEPTPTGNPPAGAIVHQWGGDANAATCPGVIGLCDRSTFYGTDADWAKFRRFPVKSAGETPTVVTVDPVLSQPRATEVLPGESIGQTCFQKVKGWFK